MYIRSLDIKCTWTSYPKSMEKMVTSDFILLKHFLKPKLKTASHMICNLF